MDKSIDQIERSFGLSSSEDGKTAVTATPLAEVLMGKRLPTDREPLPELVFFDPSLNDSQKDAVRFVLESPEIGLIHGPPGVRPFIQRVVVRVG